MKRFFSPNGCAVPTVIAGILGCGLRIWLYTTGVDEKGFLMRGTLPEILTWVLTGLVLIMLILSVRKAPKRIRYSDAFPAFVPGGLGCLAAAAGIVVALFMNPARGEDILSYLTDGFGIAAVISLILLAVCRFKGERPFFLFHTLVTVYYLMYVITQYRYWDAQPQMQNYLFMLLAQMLLMITTYHRAALTVGVGSYRTYLFFNRFATFFCCLALISASWDVYLFYMTMAMWLLADGGMLPEGK